MKIPRYYLPDDLEVEFTWDEPDEFRHYTFRIFGRSYGKSYSIHMSREGMRMLVQEMIKAL